jgi:endonuclease G
MSRRHRRKPRPRKRKAAARTGWKARAFLGLTVCVLLAVAWVRLTPGETRERQVAQVFEALRTAATVAREQIDDLLADKAPDPAAPPADTPPPPPPDPAPVIVEVLPPEEESLWLFGGRAAIPADTITFGGIPDASGWPHPLTLLRNTGFKVAYCEHKRNPIWVAYRVHDVPEGPAPPRPSRFTIDARTQSRVNHDCFTRSGFDRGHMAPNFAIATRFGEEAQRETFRMTNVSPQSPNLNRRVWEGLERRIAREYARAHGEVWVKVGPVFNKPSPRINCDVAVPAAFWKVILALDEAGTPLALAFIIPQEVEGNEDPAIFLTSIAEIQRLTGLDLFHELPDDFEAAFEAAVAEGLW